MLCRYFRSGHAAENGNGVPFKRNIHPAILPFNKSITLYVDKVLHPLSSLFKEHFLVIYKAPVFFGCIWNRILYESGKVMEVFDIPILVYEILQKKEFNKPLKRNKQIVKLFIFFKLPSYWIKMIAVVIVQLNAF